MVDMQRHARHLVLPQVGLEGQKKLAEAKVFVVGAGGLGSPVLLYLAAAGIGTIGIIDDDRVDISNLQRQVLHRTEDVGRFKVESAKEQLLALDPNLTIVEHEERLNPENVIDLFTGWDIVVDGTDNIPTRYLIDDACHLLSIPWVYGSIHRFEGQVSFFSTKENRRYRDLFPEAPPASALQNCAEAGVFGVLPGVIGSIQATEVIKYIVGMESSLIGRLLLYDAESMTMQSLRFDALDTAPDITDLSTVQRLFDDPTYCIPRLQQVEKHEVSAETMMQSITVPELKSKQQGGWNPFIIDVRSDQELEQVRLSIFDLHVIHDVANTASDDIPQDRDVVVMCRSGMRSQMAIMLLDQSGIDSTRLFNLTGGIMAWAQIAPEDIVHG
ncbi:MAG: molybdenum cofactor biosynthesis protein MoeB [Euryarchaeota archaeon]|nr:molybdenum cofactor biosynthesis protein MoeB [Euryarchaeota archaeon]|tara:strand:+ start:420 stop:1574 length:1155 start_codon:yes stop_codon:yes gene_type:complete